MNLERTQQILFAKITIKNQFPISRFSCQTCQNPLSFSFCLNSEISRALSEASPPSLASASNTQLRSCSLVVLSKSADNNLSSFSPAPNFGNAFIAYLRTFSESSSSTPRNQVLTSSQRVRFPWAAEVRARIKTTLSNLSFRRHFQILISLHSRASRRASF
jgi:hypothetical protein